MVTEQTNPSSHTDDICLSSFVVDHRSPCASTFSLAPRLPSTEPWGFIRCFIRCFLMLWGLRGRVPIVILFLPVVRFPGWHVPGSHLPHWARPCRVGRRSGVRRTNPNLLLNTRIGTQGSRLYDPSSHNVVRTLPSETRLSSWDPPLLPRPNSLRDGLVLHSYIWSRRYVDDDYFRSSYSNNLQDAWSISLSRQGGISWTWNDPLPSCTSFLTVLLLISTDTCTLVHLLIVLDRWSGHWDGTNL